MVLVAAAGLFLVAATTRVAATVQAIAPGVHGFGASRKAFTANKIS